MHSYKPLHGERGMLFYGTMQPLWELTSPLWNADKLFAEHGCPVEPYIVDIYTKETLALPHQIGILDEGTQMREMTTGDMNYILGECEGYVYIDIEEKGSDVIPLLVDSKVVLRYPV